MSDLHINLVLLHPDAQLPSFAHDGDAGADLTSVEDVVLAPGERKLVRTGLSIALPNGYVGLVHPRSGLAVKNGLSIVNAPGTVDAGYRGEIFVNLINLDRSIDIELPAGSRIAQLVIQKVERPEFAVISEHGETERGTDGHGSTGVTNV
jgi:dUTP pyrophosphatase